MPPRHAYWTIILDNLPTAFRAASREELLPTFERLRRTHPSAVLRWFARGRLWDSPAAAEQAARPPREPRGRDWRPGGTHRDPRDRFRKEQQARWRALRERTRMRRMERPAPGEERPGTPRPPRPEPPPGPERPPRPGREPKPRPGRPEEIVIPSDPPERGSARGRPKAAHGPKGARRPSGRPKTGRPPDRRRR